MNMKAVEHHLFDVVFVIEGDYGPISYGYSRLKIKKLNV